MASIKLSERLMIRLTEEDGKKLDKLVEHEGETRAALVRRLIRKHHKAVFEPSESTFSVTVPKGVQG